METFLWILGIGAVILWFVHSGWDSSYNDMVERMNEETDEEKRLREIREKEETDAEHTRITEALNKAKYALVDHPKYGTVTWTGKGRKPKWIVEYLAEGRDLSEIEYPPKKITNSENFIIKINQDLSSSKGPHGSFVHHKFKDVKGDLWFDPDRTLYDFDGVAIVPTEVIDELKRQGFNMSYAEDDHTDTDV